MQFSTFFCKFNFSFVIFRYEGYDMSIATNDMEEAS